MILKDKAVLSYSSPLFQRMSLTAMQDFMALAYVPGEELTGVDVLKSYNGKIFTRQQHLGSNVALVCTACGREHDNVFVVASRTHTNFVVNVLRVQGPPVGGVELPETTSGELALAYHAGRLWLAWTGTDGGHHLNLISAPWGTADFSSKITLSERASSSPSIASIGGRLCLAWAGVDDRRLNIAFSEDGFNWLDKTTLAETGDPAIAEDNGGLVLAWAGTDRERHINLLWSADGGKNWGAKLTTGECSAWPIYLSRYLDKLYLGWVGTDAENRLNVARVTRSPGEARMIDLPDTGGFNTQQLRPWHTPQLVNGANIAFQSRYAKPPGLPMGFSALDLDHSRNIRVAISTDSLSQDGFHVYLNSWADSVLYSAGCTWLKVPPNENDLQWGVFNTTEDHPWDHPQQSTIKQVRFARLYSYPPRVVVWLNELDFSSSRGWRVVAYASDVTTTGFTLHIDTWSDTILYSAGVTWIAHAESDRIASGTFSTEDVRPWYQPQLNNSMPVRFPHAFRYKPLVTMGLSALDFNNQHNLRISATASEITTAGMTAHLDSWSDSTMYSARGAYIAMQPNQVL